jgi:hypothetical protein
MPQMHEIARKLREIFGWETELLCQFGQDSLLGKGEGEMQVHGEGITSNAVKREVERILDPRQRKRPDNREEEIGGLCLNVNPDERFDVITQVRPILHDPEQHGVYARKVARHARNLRRYLVELGLRLQPQRQRVRGKMVDRTQLRALVQRGDPRILIAREIQVQTDLFLGVIVDCSGSMYGENIEKAKLFGTLIAEAVRGVPGIDARLFGFTDSIIFDAGDAQRCGIHGLSAGGGNNDAAGLWHAAQVARASRRRAKVLVMISDGLPTECSVAALRALVLRLSKRWKMCCAQVAVRPLEEVCFPHYILMEDQDTDRSVRRFGTIVARLVRKTLHGG